MKTVRVLGSSVSANFLRYKYSAVIETAPGDLPSPKESPVDLLLFTGGQDIGPNLYGETNPSIHYSPYRDAWEVAWYRWAVRNGVPMFGICRGMQLLTAMTGGTLHPHVTGHFGKHRVHIKDDDYPVQEFVVNSIHHQMCIPTKEVELAAWAENIAFSSSNPEPEALVFPSIKAVGVQWHPEMMPTSSEATSFVRHLIDNNLN